MAFAKIGIKQIAVCKKGTAGSTKTGAFALGLKNPSEFTVDHFEPVQDWLKRKFRNGLLAKIKGESIQPDMLMLKSLIESFAPDNGVDAELLAVPQSSGADGGCPQFYGASDYMGLDFEWIVNNKKRVLALDLGVALEYEEMVRILAASDGNTPTTWAFTNTYNIDATKQKHPYLYFPDSLLTAFGKDEIMDYSFSIKPEGEKSIWERKLIDFISFKVEFTLRGATIANLETALAYNQMPAFYFRQDNNVDGSYYDKFSFAANTLSCVHSFFLGDDKRYLKLVFEGQAPLGNIAFDLGATAGGDAGTTGAGGTLTLSA